MREVRSIVPYAGAGILLLAVLLATGEYGLGISTDSVSYAGAAHALQETGTLQVPITTWNAAADYAPLSHFPPLLPVSLAVLGGVLGTPPAVTGLWVNALCLVVVAFLLLRIGAGGNIRLLLVVAFLTNPAFLSVQLWLWSESLFLLLVVVTFCVAVEAMDAEDMTWRIVLLGVLTGLAVLTRYAGVYLWVGYIVVLWCRPVSLQKRLAQALLYTGVVAVTVSPWWFWLRISGSPARTVGWYGDGVWEQVIRELVPSLTHWLIPYWFPGWLKLLLLVSGILGTALVLVRRPQSENAKLPIAAVLSASLFVAYLLFVLAARLFADAAIPFDQRLLVPALLHLALALGFVVEAGRRSWAVTAIVATVAVIGVATNVPVTLAHLRHAANHGNGFAADTWRNTEIIAWLRRLGPGVAVYSNGADGISAVLDRPVKYTPTVHESPLIPEFEDKVRSDSPAVVVLFDDMHAHWLLGRDALGHLRGTHRVDLAGGVIIGWDSEATGGRPPN